MCCLLGGGLNVNIIMRYDCKMQYRTKCQFYGLLLNMSRIIHAIPNHSPLLGVMRSHTREQQYCYCTRVHLIKGKHCLRACISIVYCIHRYMFCMDVRKGCEFKGALENYLSACTTVNKCVDLNVIYYYSIFYLLKLIKKSTINREYITNLLNIT